MTRDRRIFSPEFKQEALELMRRSGQSANQVARDLGMNHSVLHEPPRQLLG